MTGLAFRGASGIWWAIWAEGQFIATRHCSGHASAPARDNNRNHSGRSRGSAGRLHHTSRTTTLPRTAGRTVTGLLTPTDPGHPLTGWSFSAGWGARETLDVTLVRPELVGSRWGYRASRRRRARSNSATSDIQGPCRSSAA